MGGGGGMGEERGEKIWRCEEEAGRRVVEGGERRWRLEEGEVGEGKVGGGGDGRWWRELC